MPQPELLLSISWSFPHGSMWPRKEIDLGVLGSYFFKMPVSVLLRLLTALLAAGVFTAGDGDDAGPGLVAFAPRLLPVVPWFSALDVLEPGAPPVPLSVLPLESVLPVTPPVPLVLAEPPPELPLAPCACAKEQLQSNRLSITAKSFITYLPCYQD
jgi:hypothetical protein